MLRSKIFVEACLIDFGIMNGVDVVKKDLCLFLILEFLVVFEFDHTGVLIDFCRNLFIPGIVFFGFWIDLEMFSQNQKPPARGSSSMLLQHSLVQAQREKLDKRGFGSEGELTARNSLHDSTENCRVLRWAS